MKIRVEDPKFIELQRESETDRIESEITRYMMPGRSGGHFRHPTCCLLILGQEKSYPGAKQVLDKF